MCPWAFCHCTARITFSVCLSVRQAGRQAGRQANLTLPLTLPFLNISPLTFQIILLMATQMLWCQILQVKVTFAEVLSILLISFLFWQSIRGQHKCLTEHPSSFIKKDYILSNDWVYSLCIQHSRSNSKCCMLKNKFILRPTLSLNVQLYFYAPQRKSI